MESPSMSKHCLVQWWKAMALAILAVCRAAWIALTAPRPAYEDYNPDSEALQ